MVLISVNVLIIAYLHSVLVSQLEIMNANHKKVAPLPRSNTIPKPITSVGIPAPALPAPASPAPMATHPEDTTQTSDIAPTQEFHRFMDLPYELRIPIWRIAAEVPRIVGLKNGKLSKFFVGTAARCPLVNVCKEARNEVKRVKKNIYEGIPHAPEIYANLAVDTLWLVNYNSTFEHFVLPLKGVRRLAISADIWRNELFKFHSLEDFDLEELILVVDSQKIGEGDEAVFVEPRRSPGERSDIMTWGFGLLPWKGEADISMSFLSSVRIINLGM